KGAAYVMAGLPVARGRLPTDIDILVRPSDLATVETALRARGWRPAKSDPYDDWYYRRHMHELPPLRHAVRGTIMDVHHTIAPPSGRLAIDAGRLWAEAVPLGGRLSVPSPTTMIVHAAIHLFQNGEIGGELCELLDGHQLLSGFGDRAGFWDDLLTRTRDLGAARPVFYMLRYAEAVFGTAVPAWVWSRLGVPASPLAVRVMDGLVPKTLVPPVRGDLSGAAARGALYLRGHWLRMPPRPLLRHLLRKSARAAGLPSFPPA
ncbi:MAG TPA: nucleotidyltransferase family protein, partial [Arenibaculum sp.]|nr:nucleotidyltransferase family protein [Arenibaculum sp.]